jgi:hypothetical protein
VLEQKIDYLKEKGLGNESILRIAEEIAVNTKIEERSNGVNLVEILNDSTNIINSHAFPTLSISQSYNEAIDSFLSNLIQLSSLGQELYTHGVSWLIICGIILLLSLLCPTIITRAPKQEN